MKKYVLFVLTLLFWVVETQCFASHTTSHKISKYIDYPNMKELFLSLQRIIMRAGSPSPVGATGH